MVEVLANLFASCRGSPSYHSTHFTIPPSASIHLMNRFVGEEDDKLCSLCRERAALQEGPA